MGEILIGKALWRTSIFKLVYSQNAKTDKITAENRNLVLIFFGFHIKMIMVTHT